MANGTWISILNRQPWASGPIGWDEIIVGYDFSLLAPREIQDWARDLAGQSPLCQALVALDGKGLEGFEAALWEACAQCTGKVPRPGCLRWIRAQDRWRVAMLREAMALPLSPEALGQAVESIYDQVGCPEDMLVLWHYASPWQHGQAVADRAAILRFLAHWDDGYRQAV